MPFIFTFFNILKFNLVEEVRRGIVFFKNIISWGNLQDGGRVRHGDHLPSHRYIRNTSRRGTAPTGHPLNAGRRRQTS